MPSAPGTGLAPAGRPGTAIAHRWPSDPADRAVGDRREPGAAADGCKDRPPGSAPGSSCPGTARRKTDSPVRSDEPKWSLRCPQRRHPADYVGSLENAAKVISALYRGEKRLVFCDSKRFVESWRGAARARCHHAPDPRVAVAGRAAAGGAGVRRGSGLVIVSTSALELGLDVGDLDRVIQINAPLTVAAFLQRLVAAGGGRERGATACSWRWPRTTCCSRRGCCSPGRAGSSSRSAPP